MTTPPTAVAANPAIQDFYPPEFAHCFGCGPANPHGFHLKSRLDGDETIARFTPPSMYSGGYPGHAYGGVIASLLDCHGTASAAAFAWRDRGIRPEIGDVPVRFVTASLKLDFRRPTPLGVELTLRGRLVSVSGRKAVVALTLGAGDEVSVTAEMVAVEIPAKRAAE